MSRLSSLGGAEHRIEWQVNLTHVLILLLALYVVYTTDVLEGVATADGDGRTEAAEIAVEETA